MPESAGKWYRIYSQTQEGNGQRELMIDLEDKGELYDDVLRLIKISERQLDYNAAAFSV